MSSPPGQSARRLRRGSFPPDRPAVVDLLLQVQVATLDLKKLALAPDLAGSVTAHGTFTILAPVERKYSSLAQCDGHAPRLVRPKDLPALFCAGGTSALNPRHACT